MGRQPGRGAALTPALAETLAAVAGVLATAEEAWWVIGSAAVVLHGGDTDAGDVDVLLSIADASRVAKRTGRVARPGTAHPLFRSASFFAWSAPPLTVEFMAETMVARGDAWVPVAPVTRQRITVAGGSVFVPSRREMQAMLTAFGRPKDERRLALLR